MRLLAGALTFILAAEIFGSSLAAAASGAAEGCMRTDGVRNFHVVDDWSLILDGPAGDLSYRIEFSEACHGAEDKRALALPSATGEICGGRGDYVLFHRLQCEIASITRTGAQGGE